jgi:putative membrane protein
LIWIIPLALVGALVWLLTREPRGPGPGNSWSALEILEERYARGEIGKEEFEQKKRDLRRS